MTAQALMERKLGQMVLHTRVIEQAIHGKGSWSASFLGRTYPVLVTYADERVSFRFTVEGELPRGDHEAVLLYDGEMVLCPVFEFPGLAEGATVNLKYSLDFSPAPARV